MALPRPKRLSIAAANAQRAGAGRLDALGWLDTLNHEGGDGMANRALARMPRRIRAT